MRSTDTVQLTAALASALCQIPWMFTLRSIMGHQCTLRETPWKVIEPCSCSQSCFSLQSPRMMLGLSSWDDSPSLPAIRYLTMTESISCLLYSFYDGYASSPWLEAEVLDNFILILISSYWSSAWLQGWGGDEFLKFRSLYWHARYRGVQTSHPKTVRVGARRHTFLRFQW